MEKQQNKDNDHNPVTIVDLNDDCLEYIFERILDLPQQIQIAKCSIRFRNIMMGLWKRQTAYNILDFGKLSTVLSNYDDFKYFLIAMKQEFHTLRIIENCLSVLEKMEECDIDCFPAIVRCEFDDDPMECFPQDDVIHLFTKLLPNLKYLYTSVHITGRHIADFKYLEELHLFAYHTNEYEMRQEYLKDILLNLKNLRVLDIRNINVSHLKLMPEISECIQLQELKLSLDTLKPVLDHVLKMPRLKHLRVRVDQDIYETKEYYHILKEKGQFLTGLAIDFFEYLPLSMLPCRLNDFHYINPANLKLLALCSFDFSSREDCLVPFTGLEMLYLPFSKNLQSLTILEIVRLCPNLKHLDLSYTSNLDVSLLNQLHAFLQKEKRSTSLCVYYESSDIEDEIVKNLASWTSQKYLQFSNDLAPGADYFLGFFNLGFAVYF